MILGAGAKGAAAMTATALRWALWEEALCFAEPRVARGAIEPAASGFVPGEEEESGFITVMGGWGLLTWLLAQEEKSKAQRPSKRVIARMGVMRFKGASNGQSGLFFGE